jgi:uncharacterized protein YndB with AHSA1/START domain
MLKWPHFESSQEVSMAVKHDQSGRRWVEVEVEVPGTPEEVWEAIATGPGVTSWFVPTEFRGDTVVANFGPGMDSLARITVWDPPRRFVADSSDLGPGAPPVGSEWIVEARSGGTCVVRVVHSLFASSEEWDNQLESFESGWPDFFRILRAYLTHFRGQTGRQIQVMGFAAEPASAAWEALTAALGFAHPTKGQRARTRETAPALAGVVDDVMNEEAGRQMHLRLDQPAPGIAHLFALAMGGQVCLSLRAYLYGEDAAAIVERDQAAWEAWMSNHFPAPAAAPSDAAV